MESDQALLTTLQPLMANNYAKRVERLEELLAAKLNQPVAVRFLPFDPAHTAEDYARGGLERGWSRSLTGPS